MPLTVSIMITTRNRLRDLQRTCEALRRLVPAPLEILIAADGCTDDTVDFVRAEMPDARLTVNSPGRGSIASRDKMLCEARGDLVLSLDDDSYPQEPDALANIARIFEERSQMAVLHFPQCTDEYPETLTGFDFGPARLTRSYSSSGAVLRRSAYLQLPGYDPAFFHAYEEPDYSLQCVAAGFEILYTPEVSIRHYYSGLVRNECRTHHRHARNEFWSVLMRCPFPHVVALAGYRILSQMRYAAKRGPAWVLAEPVWWWQALGGIPGCLGKRQPLSWNAYRSWLALPDIVYPPQPATRVPSAVAAPEPVETT